MTEKRIIEYFVSFEKQETPQELKNVIEEILNKEDESENIKNENIDLKTPYSICCKDERYKSKQLRIGYFRVWLHTPQKEWMEFSPEIIVSNSKIFKTTQIAYIRMEGEYNKLEAIKDVLGRGEDNFIEKIVKINKEDIKKIVQEGKKKGLLELIE